MPSVDERGGKGGGGERGRRGERGILKLFCNYRISGIFRLMKTYVYQIFND